MSREAFKITIRRFFEEVWNKGKLEVADEIIDPNYIRHRFSVSDIEGLEAFKQFMVDVRSSYPDFKAGIEDIIVEGNTVVTQGTWQGTQTGPSPSTGTPPTDKHVTVPYCVISHLVNGKVVEEWDYQDWLGLLQQLGVVAPLEQGIE